jgi:hypothetical protein
MHTAGRSPHQAAKPPGIRNAQQAGVQDANRQVPQQRSPWLAPPVSEEPNPSKSLNTAQRAGKRHKEQMQDLSATLALSWRLEHRGSQSANDSTVQKPILKT